jgi:hypothetical protein
MRPGLTVPHTQPQLHHLYDLYDLEPPGLTNRITACAAVRGSSLVGSPLGRLYPPVYLEALTCKLPDQAILSSASA